uniref:Uncharacterized protein n=1 Tax=Strigamia maritima TaxID=126957 RepID=T1IHG8_STRMM
MALITTHLYSSSKREKKKRCGFDGKDRPGVLLEREHPSTRDNDDLVNHPADENDKVSDNIMSTNDKDRPPPSTTKTEAAKVSDTMSANEKDRPPPATTKSKPAATPAPTKIPEDKNRPPPVTAKTEPVVKIQPPPLATAKPEPVVKDPGPNVPIVAPAPPAPVEKSSGAVSATATSTPTTGPKSSAADKKESVPVGQRLLLSSQKGDWPAVEQIIRHLERAQIGSASNGSINFGGGLDETGGLTPFMYAVKDNKVVIAERLLDLGANLNDKAKDGFTALHFAATYGKEEMLKMLINRRADGTIVGGPKQQLALHIVCSRTYVLPVPVLQQLLRLSGRESRLAIDKDGKSPLFLAVEHGHLTIVKELLSIMADSQLKLTKRGTGDTVLHLAARKHDLDILRMLVEFGAQVDAQNNDGQTVMHLAAADGDDPLMRFLLQAKANPNISDRLDRTPLHVAAEKGNTQVVDILTDKFKASVAERTKDGNTMLHIACMSGHPDTALAFLRKGVPFQMPNRAGARAIHTASKYGHVPVVLALLLKGEQVDSKTNDNYTALHIAVEACRPAVVEILLGHGAEVDLKGGKNGETPLHIAARVVGGEKCAGMLLKSGADVNAAGENGETALHIAARYGHLQMVELLLEDGANPNFQSKVGESPLHIAVRHCHYPVAAALLNYGGRSKEFAARLVNLQTCEGESALHYAAEITKDTVHHPNEDVDIVRTLMELDGDINLMTKATNETAIHYAARAGNSDVLLEMTHHISANLLQTAMNKQAGNGWSPLLVASEQGHLEVVNILLQNHARVDVFDESGKAALHVAAEKGHRAVVDVLLQHKAFVNARSKVGITPLHLAAMNGYNQLVTSLIESNGAMMDAFSLSKQTPLHMAAQNGQLQVCSTLLDLKADSNTTDELGQTPLHLAAENDHSDVVKLFLKHRPELVSMANSNGFTCAHIAAMKGSEAVIEELMRFNKVLVITARNKTSDSTSLHLAAEGGHDDVVRMLLTAGASATDENREGLTAVHLAAKHGHLNVLDALKSAVSGRVTSKKTGLTALHVAAQFGQTDVVRELLTYIPATVKSEPPAAHTEGFFKDAHADSGLTPLHLAAQWGHENIVRILLNSPGVQADAPTNVNATTPLHMAAQGGHTAVAGLLLSKSTNQLHLQDKRGRTALHLAATHGHLDMVSMLIGQGAEIDATDFSGMTSLHCAAKHGFIKVVEMLVESGASTKTETTEGKIPLSYAAASGHNDIVSFLTKKDMNPYTLIEDKKFIYDLMVSGKNINNKPIEEFILVSKAPVDIAVKLARNFTVLSTKEKDRAKDLEVAASYCENMAKELLALAASINSAGSILRAVDSRNIPFLDVLIELEQKEVVAHPAVQKYLTDVWMGNLRWGTWRIVLVFFAFIFVPPVWVTFSLPLNHRYNRTPIIKFMSYLVSHIFFIILLILTISLPIYPLHQRWSLAPKWVEYVLLIWLAGMLVSELTNPGDRAGLGWLKVVILAICAVGIVIHIVALMVFSLLDQIDREERVKILYIRNQFLGISLFLSFTLLLDYLTFHYLFGPWTIIIRNLLSDLGRFLVILSIFLFGFTFQIMAIGQITAKPVNITEVDCYEKKNPIHNAFFSFEYLITGMFGMMEQSARPCERITPDFAFGYFKLSRYVYLLVTLVVLVNLLIAMLSDTYQRIQAQSDLEWKYGRAKLIRNMNKMLPTPSPFNLLTQWMYYTFIIWKHRGKFCKKPKFCQRLKFKKVAPPAPAPGIGRAGGNWAKALKRGAHVAPSDNSTLALNRRQGLPLGPSKIENVVDWHMVCKKYLELIGSTKEDK